MAEITLNEMIENLQKVSDLTWGRYAFSRDILKDKITEAEKTIMITEAIRCGEEYADSTLLEFGDGRMEDIAQKYGLKVTINDEKMTANKVIFALFTPPDHISIMKEPIAKVKYLLEKLTENKEIVINSDQITDILIGHEIFHYLEEKNEKEIFTRKKIKLWSLPFYTNYSTIRALGEIAGMYYTKKMNHLSYSPFMMDVILYFGFDPLEARKIYQEIMELEYYGFIELG